MLMPAFKKARVQLQSVASSGGVSAVHYGKKYGFEEATTDISSILGDEKINTVVIATRHNTHAELVIEALKAGKHVFVEKPLCLTMEELQEIVTVVDAQKNHPQITQICADYCEEEWIEFSRRRQ